MSTSRTTAASLDELLGHSTDSTDSTSNGSAAMATPSRGNARWAGAAAATAVVLALLVAAFWWATGGRWQTISTPSMGEAAPVGTLVLTRPVLAADVRVGDIVTFRSPAAAGRIYTHRVVDIDATGGLHTRGDINGGDDPGVLHSKDLVGKVVARWWGIGWLMRTLPLLLIGGAVLWFVTRRWALPSSRTAIRVLGMSILVSICAVLLKPFVNFAVVTNVPGDRSSHLTLVSTGLFPIRVQATGGAHLDLVDGRIGELTATGDPGPNGYQFTSGVHFSLMWWIVLVLIWLTPLLLAVLLSPRQMRVPDGVDPTPPAPPSPPAAPAVEPEPREDPRPIAGRHRQRLAHGSAFRLLGPLIGVVAIVAAIVPASQSAFAARVTNSTNVASSNPYFTCTAAATSTAGPAFFAYPLSEQTVFVTADDVAGNRNGTYNLLGSWSSSTSRPCLRDTLTSAVVSGGLPITQSYIYTGTPVTNPTVFSVEIWFKTGGTVGGRLIGFGSNQTLTSGSTDRHLYLSTNGQLNFGVSPGGTNRVLTSPVNTPTTANYGDGQWHQAIGTLGANGMRLYVDGALVASDTTVISARNYTGYWRVGYDSLNGWPNAPLNANYRGSLAWASVYTSELSPTLVSQHYAAGL